MDSITGVIAENSFQFNMPKVPSLWSLSILHHSLSLKSALIMRQHPETGSVQNMELVNPSQPDICMYILHNILQTSKGDD